jgi:serine/threonine-protein kinase
MAPEQASAGEVDARTDLYSVGVLAYELFTGRQPFDPRLPLHALIYKHVYETPPSPRSVDPSIPAALDAWIERMLAKHPQDRPASAGEAWSDLEEICVDDLGWRWRREARLGEHTPRSEPAPLTPAPFADDPPAAGPADGAAERDDSPAGGSRDERSSEWQTFVTPPPPREMSTAELEADLGGSAAASSTPARATSGTEEAPAADLPEGADSARDGLAETRAPQAVRAPAGRHSPATEPNSRSRGSLRSRARLVAVLVLAGLMVGVAAILVLIDGDDPQATNATPTATASPTPTDTDLPAISSSDAERAARSMRAGAGFHATYEDAMEVTCERAGSSWTCRLQSAAEPRCTARVDIPVNTVTPMRDARIVTRAQTQQFGC